MENVVRGVLEYELPYLKKYAKMMDVLASNINTIEHMLTHTTIKLPRRPPPSVQRPMVIERRLDVPKWVSMFVYALPYVHMVGIILDESRIAMSFDVSTDVYSFSPVDIFISLDSKADLRSIIILSTLSDDLISLIAESMEKLSTSAYKNLEMLLEIASSVKSELELCNSTSIDPSSFYEPLTDHDQKYIGTISTFVRQIIEPPTNMPYKVRYGDIDFVFPHKETLSMYNQSVRVEKHVEKNVEVPSWLVDLMGMNIIQLNTISINPTSIMLEAYKTLGEGRRGEMVLEEFITYISNGQSSLNHIMLSHYLLDDDTRRWIDDTLYELVLLSERVKEKIKDLAVLVNVLE